MGSNYLKHYEQVLARYYTWIFDDLDTGKSRAENELSELLKGNVHEGIALDLGCGPGYFALVFSELGYDVVAVDTSQALLSSLRNAIPDNNKIDIVESDMREYLNAIDSDSIQIIAIMGDTISHLDKMEDINSLFGDTYRVLKVGGKLLLSYRDQTSAKAGESLVIPIKSGDKKLFVAAMEFSEQSIRVIDTMFTLEKEKWIIESSVYNKLLLKKEIVTEMLTASGFELTYPESIGGIEFVGAVKQ